MAMTDEERKSRDCKRQKAYYAVRKDDPAFKAANCVRASEWKKMHPDAVKQRSAEWYGANRERVLETRTERRKQHPEVVAREREYDRQRYIEHPELAERNRAGVAKWRIENPEKSRARVAKYRLENLEKVKAKDSKWKDANPGKRRLSHTKSKAKHRLLGCIPLNQPFVGSQGHHVDHDHILYIPLEPHTSVPHNIWTGRNMDKINALAYRWAQLEVAQ